jgi:hypothetical protein
MSEKSKVGLRVTAMSAPRSRREAIGIGLAALAGMGLSALAPSTALATTGTMTFGTTNDAGTADTRLDSSTANATMILVNTNATNGSVLACDQQGGSSYAARFAHSGSGQAILAYQSGSGTAVEADCPSPSNASPAIHGAAAGGNNQGVLGESSSVFPNARGVMGKLTAAAAQGAAVEGTVNSTDANSIGVWGKIDSLGKGTGIKASNWGTSGGALRAEVTNAANTGAAVSAVTSGTGYAVVAHGSKALRVEGTLSMTRSGRATIAKGKSYVMVTVPGGLSWSASVICTLQNSAGSGVYVLYAKRASGTQFKIQLSKAASYTAYVAWMVLG